jgi:hypothetical protein
VSRDSASTLFKAPDLPAQGERFDILLLVNVPSPARYALHKVVIARRRATGQAAKARKDIQQATLLPLQEAKGAS